MVHEDNLTCGINDGLGSFASQEYICALPSIANEFTNPIASAFKLEYSGRAYTRCVTYHVVRLQLRYDLVRALIYYPLNLIALLMILPG
jgi:hypothetical protein